MKFRKYWIYKEGTENTYNAEIISVCHLLGDMCVFFLTRRCQG